MSSTDTSIPTIFVGAINLANCSKNVINDSTTYNRFDKTCTSSFSGPVRKVLPSPGGHAMNPLIYCPTTKDGTVLSTPTVDENGNVYCTNDGFYCKPKINPFTSDRDPTHPESKECGDYCPDVINKFFVNGIPKVPVSSNSQCKIMCETEKKCTGYTYYNDKELGPTCMMYSVNHDNYHKYQPFDFSTYSPSHLITDPTNPVTELVGKTTETNGFPCTNDFSTYKRTGIPIAVDTCINNINDPVDENLKTKLVDAVKDLSCQYAACTTEYKKDSGKMTPFNLFKHSNTLSGAVSHYFKDKDYSFYLKLLYGISGATVFYMIIRFFLYKVVGGFTGNRYNIFKAFFGNSKVSSGILFMLASGLSAFAVVYPMAVGDFAPALYTVIVCTCVLILFLAIANVLLTLRGFSNWKIPGGFQLIFMIIIILGSLAASVYFLYESIRDKDYGLSTIESEAPFIKIPKIHNYGYVALIATGVVGAVALFLVIIELFSKMKTAQYKGEDMSVKSNTKGIGVIASALYGIFGGVNLVLAIFAPFILLTLAIFERIFGSIVTSASKKEGFFQNLIINIGTAISNASFTPKRRSRRRSGNVESEYLKIGQEFFGGGPSNGWAPFGTTLLNIILAMMTNYNYVLSRSSIEETRTSGHATHAEMNDNIRVLDKEMWFVASRSKDDNKDKKLGSIWLRESNNRTPATTS